MAQSGLVIYIDSSVGLRVSKTLLWFLWMMVRVPRVASCQRLKSRA